MSKKKIEVASSKAKMILRLRPYDVMTECVEKGIRYGLTRLGKHGAPLVEKTTKKGTRLTIDLSIEDLAAQVVDYVMFDIADSFVFVEDPEVVREQYEEYS